MKIDPWGTVEVDGKPYKSSAVAPRLEGHNFVIPLDAGRHKVVVGKQNNDGTLVRELREVKIEGQSVTTVDVKFKKSKAEVQIKDPERASGN